jgi:hypothetical protein
VKKRILSIFVVIAMVALWIWYKSDTESTPTDSSTEEQTQSQGLVAEIDVSPQEMSQLEEKSKEFAMTYFSYDGNYPKSYLERSSFYLHSQFPDSFGDEIQKMNEPNKLGVKTIGKTPKKVELLQSYVDGVNVCVFLYLTFEDTLQYQDGKTEKVEESYNRLIVWEKEANQWKVRRVESEAYMEPD